MSTRQAPSEHAASARTDQSDRSARAESIDRALLDAVPYVVVRDGVIVTIGPAVAMELGCPVDALLGPLHEIGTRLDDVTFDDLCRGDGPVRVRLVPDLLDRPVQLRRLGETADGTWIEVRSLADEFRLASLLRRSGIGHMLISPDIELQWSMTSNELADVFPGDNPLNWIELMDPDDMQALGRAIYKVGRDPNLRRMVPHRLRADRTHAIIDTVESAIHDPDLKAVLVRSRLQESMPASEVASTGAPAFAGITVSDHMPIGVVLASTAGVVLHRNAVAASLVGARAGQRCFASDESNDWLLRDVAVEHSEAFRAVFDAAANGRPSHCTIPSPFAAERWLRLSASPAAASTLVLTIEDVTDLAGAERAVRASNRLLEALDAHSEERVAVFDVLGAVRYASASAMSLAESGRLSTFDEVLASVDPLDRTAFKELRARVLAESDRSDAVEVRVTAAVEETGRWHHARMTNLLDDPDVAGLVLTVRDVHERRLAERELQFLATHDVLTTLPDRGGLRKRLETVLAEAQLFARRTALVFCDIDYFKQINDRFGHHNGDLVLTEVAARLRAALRSSDFVGRFGGDEFVVVLQDVDDQEHAMAVASRVFASVTGRVRLDRNEFDLTVSMGVAVTDESCTTADELLRRADVAMYDSKRSGRGRLSLFDPTTGSDVERQP